MLDWRKKAKRALILILCLAVAPAAIASSSFFNGKVMTVVVPYGVGGHFDTWARMIAPYMAQQLGLKSVRIVNRPGGGGLIGSNAIYNAKPDGLTIGDINAPGDYFAQLDHASGVRFRLQSFSWIGRPDDDPAALAVHPGGQYQTFDQLTKVPKDHPVTVLASGKGSNEYNAAYITLRAFHVPFRMVAAFKGAHAVIAGFVSGEGDLMPMAASHMAELGKQVHVILAFTTQPYSKLSAVPTVVAEAKEHHLSGSTTQTLAQLASVMSLGHAFVAPPGVPAARLRALRDAFAATFSNPDFLAKAKKAGLYLGYKSGHEVRRMVEQSMQKRKDFRRLLVQSAQ